MGNKTVDLMKAGKTVLFAFEEAIGIDPRVLVIIILNISYGGIPVFLHLILHSLNNKIENCSVMLCWLVISLPGKYWLNTGLCFS